MEVREYFRISEAKGREIIEKVKTAVRNWKSLASRYGISRSEQELKAGAFMQAEL